MSYRQDLTFLTYWTFLFTLNRRKYIPSNTLVDWNTVNTQLYHLRPEGSLPYPYPIQSQMNPAHTLLTSVYTYILLLKSHCDWRLVSKSWCRALSGAHDHIFFTVWQLRSCFCGAPSLMRGRVCLLYMLLALSCAVFLVTIFYCLRFQTSLFVASYD
jgi:hypothetical protein